MDSHHPEEQTESNTYELIEEGPASTVSRTWAAIGPHAAQWVIVKTATTAWKASQEPHDILKELRILSELTHSNIIEVWSHTEDGEWSELHIWEPYIPIALSDLLVSPRFSPFTTPSSSEEQDEESVKRRKCHFTILARSIIYQTLQALAYLHNPSNCIAHRDIKPRNILLTDEGCVKLIDFGIAWQEQEEDEANEDVWPEQRPKMYFEVSTGPYRAPELLFGTRDYDAFAIDLWSAGATFAEFFTPLRLLTDSNYNDEESPYEEEDEGKETSVLEPFIVPRDFVGAIETRWERDTLFNGTRGELGLAWSIFKIRGTPTKDNWPAFERLPDSTGIEFTVVPPVPLPPLLPNLPDANPHPEGQTDLPSIHTPDKVIKVSALDLIERLLVYPVENRLVAARAVEHPWFSGEGGLLVPVGYPRDLMEKVEVVLEEVDGKPLGYWVQNIFSSGGPHS